MIHENPFPSSLPRHCQALTSIFFFSFFNQLHSLISIQLSSLINKNCPRVAPKLQEELHFLVLFSMIGKLSDNNYLLCSFQVVSTTFQVMEKEVVELPLVVRWGVCQGQVTILSFQSFLFIEIFFYFKLFFFYSIKQNVTVDNMTSINNCFCRVTSRPYTHALKEYLVFSKSKALCFLLLLKEMSPYRQTSSNSIKWNKRSYLFHN